MREGSYNSSIYCLTSMYKRPENLAQSKTQLKAHMRLSTTTKYHDQMSLAFICQQDEHPEKKRLYDKNDHEIVRNNSSSARGIRFRARKQDYVAGLQNSVGSLKVLNEQLRHKLESFPKYVDHIRTYDMEFITHPALNIVNEYMELFQNGISVVHSERRTCDINLYMKQILFIHNNMASNVMLNDMYKNKTILGKENIFNQWFRFSQAHSSVKSHQIRSHLIQSEPTPIVVTCFKIRIIFSQYTIEVYYPHLLWDNESMQELIGLEMDIAVECRFHFGSTNDYNENRIVKIEAAYTYLPGLVEALESVEDAITLSEYGTFDGSQQPVLPDLTIALSRMGNLPPLPSYQDVVSGNYTISEEVEM